MDERLKTLRKASYIISAGAFISYVLLTVFGRDACIVHRVNNLVLFTVQCAFVTGGEMICKKNCIVSFLLTFLGMFLIFKTISIL